MLRDLKVWSSICIRVPLGNLKYKWTYSSVNVVAFHLWVYSVNQCYLMFRHLQVNSLCISLPQLENRLQFKITCINNQTKGNKKINTNTMDAIILSKWITWLMLGLWQVHLACLYCYVLHDFILLQFFSSRTWLKPCYILYIVSFGFHFWRTNNLLLKVALLGISIVVKVNVGVSIDVSIWMWVINIVENVENVLSVISELS